MTASASEQNRVAWSPAQWAGAVLMWLWVLIPFCYGLYQLIIKIPALFG